MKTDSIMIKIATQDLKILRDAEYHLCIAGRMKDTDFTVVWYATGEFTLNNIIEINDEYEVFASNRSTKKVFEDFLRTPAEIGEKCIIDKYGNISQAITGDIPDGIVLVNKYGNLYPGLIRKGTGIKGEEFSNPLFLSRNAILPGEFDYFPSYEIKIWFAQNKEAGEILPQQKLRAAISDYILVDLEKRNAPVLSFSNGIWKFI